MGSFYTASSACNWFFSYHYHRGCAVKATDFYNEAIVMDRCPFTAASATTVTGLAVVDTGTEFTLFGQTVIMGLIQIGGLGFMTFAVLIVMILGKKSD